MKRANELVPYTLSAVAAACLLVAWMFYGSIESMVWYWYGHEEFGHAFLLPFISIYLIWQKRYEFYNLPVKKAWIGLLIVFSGVVLFLVGKFGAVHTIQQYALIFVLVGMFISVFGITAAEKTAIPLLLLFFMVPLPGFLYNTLSGQLQLISSQIGVFIIRLFDISVYLEGNVIDLGVYKLQVVEACSGLRYLFPLMTLGLIAAYIYRSSNLNKVIVFLSTIPITILMNSFRIGMIGVLVEFYGISMAEGFLHDFEGWIIFMACMVLLIFEMWFLNKISKDRVAFSEIFNLDVLEPEPSVIQNGAFNLSRTIVFVIPILVIGLFITSASKGNENIVPERLFFNQFPMQISNYTGIQDKFEANIIDALNFDDYLIANYTNESRIDLYNLYIGYYNTQNADKVPHSPKACLPGGGWLITNSGVVSFNDTNGKVINANRVVINRKGTKQLVYYWFKQRDRIITSEYMVKWYLLVDAIIKNRTDGALIRFVTSMSDGEDLDAAENRLRQFIVEVNPVTAKYIPD